MNSVSRPNPIAMLVPAILFMLAFVVFMPARNGAFLWDDDVSIQNSVLRDPAGIFTIWTTTGRIPAETHYWPMTYTFLWAGTQLWGGSATGFHLLNFLLHGLIVVQIWRLMRRIGLPGAWLGAAIFAVHPVHAEAVAWMIEIKDLLATGLYLVAVEFYLNHEERGGSKWLGAACAAAVAAMLSKSSAVTLPVGLAILVWYRRGRFTKRDVSGLAVIAATVFAMLAVDMRVVSRLESAIVAPPLASRLVQSGFALWHYAGKLIWPASLSAVYPQFHVAVSNPISWMPLAGIGGVTVLLWSMRKCIGRGPLACWLFYVITIVPMSGIVWFGFLMRSPVADRYQYLASLGPIVGIGALAGGFIGRQKLAGRLLLGFSTACALMLLSVLSWEQAGYYKTNLAFFSHVRKVAPESSVAYYNLGVIAFNQRFYPAAEEYFAKAHRYAPDDPLATYNLGEAMIHQGKIREAARLYRETIEAGRASLNVRASLAWLMAVSPDPEVRDAKTALALATECVERAPKMEAEFLNALAAAQAANGRADLALETARRGLRLAKESNCPDVAAMIEMALPWYENGKAYTAPY